MNIDDKFSKISMFLDGELSNAEMNNVEKIIDHDEAATAFIINAVKANAYSKSFSRNEMGETELLIPDKKRVNKYNWMLKAASIIFFVGIGTFMGNLLYDRPGSNFTLSENVINPVYQNVLNAALENYASGEPYTQNISELNMQITVIPEKTYKYKDRNYIRKFVIKYNLGDKAVNINGFAERKSKKAWEIKTLAL